jgi:hypothetical protein
MKKQGIVNVTNMPLWAHKLTKPFELLVAELRIPHGQTTHPALRYLQNSSSPIGVGLWCVALFTYCPFSEHSRQTHGVRMPHRVSRPFLPSRAN